MPHGSEIGPLANRLTKQHGLTEKEFQRLVLWGYEAYDGVQLSPLEEQLKPFAKDRHELLKSLRFQMHNY